MDAYRAGYATNERQEKRQEELAATKKETLDLKEEDDTPKNSTRTK